MSLELWTNIILGAVMFFGIVIQHHEIRGLRRTNAHLRYQVKTFRTMCDGWEDKIITFEKNFEAVTAEIAHWKSEYELAQNDMLVERTKRLAAEAALKEKAK